MNEQMPEPGFSRTNNFSAEAIIKDFGGIRPMAAKLGIPVTTVQGWKSRGHIPLNRRKPILEAARKHNVNLSDAVLRELDREPVTLTSTPDSGNETGSATGQFEESLEGPKTNPNNDVKKKNNLASPSTGTHDASRTNEKNRSYWRSGGLILLAAAAVTWSGWFVLSESNWIQSYFSGSGQVHPIKKVPALGGQETESGVKVIKPIVSKSSEETKMPDNNVPVKIEQEMTREPLEAKIENIELRLDLFQRRLEKINGSILSLAKENNYALSQFAGQVSQINDNINKMENKIKNLSFERRQGGKDIALQALLLGQLENEIFAGRPYLNRLQSLRKSLAAPVPKQIFEGLARRADQGVPTPLMLVTSFNNLAIQRAHKNRTRELKKSSSESIIERLKSELTGLFSIRRVGGSGKLPPFSMAEVAVANGDFASAADHLELLSREDLHFDSFSSWIEDVRAHIQVKQHIEKLRWHVSALLGAKPEAN